MKGEFEKEIRNEAIRNLTLWQMAENVIREEEAKRKDYVHVETVLKIVDEARKDFVEKEDRMKKVKEMIEKHYPKELGFSKRYVLDVIQGDIDLRRKWFGSEGGE